ncbi:MAG: hypothetical protein JWP16_1992 [Alphaproteobacteria bacterium]|jgi:hypothetical protein|nr:hypothetical protein [Alphaproteobacteria bacterium]MDB5740952.1 hypothetical protein [Alphaproteobacteria bacterium]
MLTIFKAAAAFAIAAVITGTSPPLSPQWRAVAADLHQAHAPGKVKAGLAALFHQGKG